eukprot:gene12826-biopygen21510
MQNIVTATRTRPRRQKWADTVVEKREHGCSHPPHPCARAARVTGVDARREARIPAPESAGRTTVMHVNELYGQFTCKFGSLRAITDSILRTITGSLLEITCSLLVRISNENEAPVPSRCLFWPGAWNKRGAAGAARGKIHNKMGEVRRRRRRPGNSMENGRGAAPQPISGMVRISNGLENDACTRPSPEMDA